MSYKPKNDANKQPYNRQQRILQVDFSDCNERQMIELLQEFTGLLIHGNRPQLLLTIHGKRDYFTTGYMRSLKSDRVKEARGYIKKHAIIGLSNEKRIIIKGYNSSNSRNIQVFGTKEEAVEYPTSD